MYDLLVSAHGGHSGQFCNHARDTLEEVIREYVRQGFAWVGITEHLTGVDDRFTYPDEREAGLDAKSLRRRFRSYFETAFELSRRYAGEIEVLVGFESETYTGSEPFIRATLAEIAPAYFVGSLHHVEDQVLDMNASTYQELARSLGGQDALYARYFDQQLEMIEALRPSVVGHFDLVRVFDPDYAERLRRPDIRARVERNLDRIRELDLQLDFNTAGFDKAAGEPYPSRVVLEAALERGIGILPGDDSHGVSTVGRHFERGYAWLREMGADLNWRKPVRTHGGPESETGPA